MELFSKKFEDLVRQIVGKKHITTVATVPLKTTMGLAEVLKNRSDSTIFTVNRDNRNSVGQDILTYVLQGM